MKTKYPLLSQVLLNLPVLVLVMICLVCFESESALLEILQRHRHNHPEFAETVGFIGSFSSIPFYAFYLGLGIKAIRDRDKATGRFVIAYVVSLLVSLLLVRFFKSAISRPRPPTPWTEYNPFSSSRSSFPSSHVSESLTTITPLCQRYRGYVLPLLLGCFPALVGFSRLYTGRHYPTDFLGSIVVGIISGSVAWWISRRMRGGD